MSEFRGKARDSQLGYEAKKVIAYICLILFMMAIIKILFTPISIMYNKEPRVNNEQINKIRSKYPNAVVDDNNGSKDYYDVYTRSGGHVRVQFSTDGKMFVSRG